MPAPDTHLWRDIRAQVRAEDIGIWILAGCLLLNVVHLALLEPNRDFGPVYDAVRAVVDGNPPYATVTRGGGYVHTPGSTLLSLPFALVSQTMGARVVVVSSAVAFVLGTLAAAAATRATPRATAIVVLAFSLSGALLRELGLGNVDALCLLPLGLALYFLTRGRPWLGGALIGIAMTVKPTVAVFLVLPLALGSVSGTLSALAVVTVLNVVALPLLPEASRFFTSVLPFLLEGNTDGFNVSLKAALKRTGIPDGLILAFRLGSVGLLIGIFVSFRAELRRHPAVLVAFLTVGTVFVTSYFFTVYLVYLALAVGVMRLIRRPMEQAMLGASAYLLLAQDVLRSRNELLDTVLGFRRVVGALLLLAALVLVLKRDRDLHESGALPPDDDLPTARAEPALTT